MAAELRRKVKAPHEELIQAKKDWAQLKFFKKGAELP